MLIEIRHKSTKPATVKKKLGEDIAIIDVTSKGEEPWVRFSPFYAHPSIPLPFSPHVKAYSVEGIWQGLKVFEGEGIDTERFYVRDMKGIKRTTRKYGTVKGHQSGIGSEELISYLDARKQIFIPSYRFVLDTYLQDELGQLKEMAEAAGLVLLDYEKNCDVENLERPLSHAGLIKAYLEDKWPA